MNRRAFLKWLGIGVPAAAVAAAAVSALVSSVPKTDTVEDWSPYPTEVKTSLGEWNNYYSECSPDIRRAIDEFEKSDYRNMLESIKTKDPVFVTLAECRMTPMNAGVSREFFQYSVGK